ncbi:MAG: biopolymer transporter ExbD [Planctomycetes bacterium]|nr:biopolymer transporter ExbD [Planctomycetota bacterium]
MGKVAEEQREKDAMFDWTPLIDVVFQLMIFFMCVTEIAKAELESLTLPIARNAIEDVDAPKNRVIINITYSVSFTKKSVTSDIIISKEPYNDQDKLIAMLKARAAAGGLVDGVSDMTVKVRADHRAEYQKIQQVMVACMKAGINKISIGAEPKQL